MRQPAQYVATVRKVNPVEFRSSSFAHTMAEMHEEETGHKCRVLPVGKLFAVWEIIPRPRHEAFYK